MSRLFPTALANNIRHMLDVSVDIYGIECQLFIPTNLQTMLEEGVYADPADYTYEEYTAKVIIEWNPNIHRLRAKGLFLEEEAPIIARFSSKGLKSGETEQRDIEVIAKSYISLSVGYVPPNVKTDKFDVVDITAEGMQDVNVLKMWKLTPRREAV